MVSCHSIAHVHDKFIGDPLDIEMFISTKWSMDEDTESSSSDIVELAKFHSPIPELSQKSKKFCKKFYNFQNVYSTPNKVNYTSYLCCKILFLIYSDRDLLALYVFIKKGR
jgi:hypothetical protein